MTSFSPLWVRGSWGGRGREQGEMKGRDKLDLPVSGFFPS